jgi:hypothetical protein
MYFRVKITLNVILLTLDKKTLLQACLQKKKNKKKKKKNLLCNILLNKIIIKNDIGAY